MHVLTSDKNEKLGQGHIQWREGGSLGRRTFSAEIKNNKLVYIFFDMSRLAFLQNNGKSSPKTNSKPRKFFFLNTALYSLRKLTLQAESLMETCPKMLIDYGEAQYNRGLTLS